MENDYSWWLLPGEEGNIENLPPRNQTGHRCMDSGGLPSFLVLFTIPTTASAVMREGNFSRCLFCCVSSR